MDGVFNSCNDESVSANSRIRSYFLETVGRSIERPCLKIKMAFAVHPLSVDGETAQFGIEDVFTAMKQWLVQIVAAEQVQIVAMMCFFREDDQMSAVQKCCQRLKTFSDTGPVIQCQF